MKRNMMWLAASAVVIALLVLGIPGFFAVRATATESAGNELTQKMTELAVFVQGGPTLAAAVDFRNRLSSKGAVDLTITTADGTFGPDQPQFALNPSAPNLDLTRTPVGSIIVQYRVLNGDLNSRVALADGTRLWELTGWVRARRISAAENHLWIRLGALGLVALALGLLVAQVLARRLSRAINGVVRAAVALGDGDLDIRVPEKGPAEVVELGGVLTRLARRIDDLLQEERDRVAGLSHTLRTPLTAVQLAAEALQTRTATEDGAGYERLQSSVGRLEAALDEVIAESRRRGENQHEHQSVTDLRAVTAANIRFWTPLAEQQGRQVQLRLPAQAVLVRARDADMNASIDVVISNIFNHTPTGVGFEVSLTTDGDRALLTIDDPGPAVSPSNAKRSGTSGIGLNIAQVAAERAGGSLHVHHPESGGTRVVIDLPVVRPTAARHGMTSANVSATGGPDGPR